MSELGIQSVNICSDVEDLFDSYEIGEIEDGEEIQDYVAKIGEVKREYRRIHSQLRVAEGDEFPIKYPEYGKTLNKLNEEFKIANKKLSEIKKAKKQNVVESNSFITENKVAFDEKKMQCKSDRKFFIEQVNWEIQDCVWQNMHDFEDIKIMVSTFETRLNNFFKICSNLEVFYGDQIGELGFDVENNKLVLSLREKINSGKSRISELKLERELLEKQKLEKEATERKLAEDNEIAELKIAEKAKIDELIICAENLHFEIQTRYEILLKKCSVDVTILSDHEVLDLRKKEENLHTELRELIDKVSAFEKFVLPCGQSAVKLRAEVTIMRSDCRTKLEKFLDKVNDAIKNRDISEKKLENSAGLNIELQKFKGYNSDVDIYTFRSEFKKLIEPAVQKGLLADYLKKNCLGGAAYNLVSKIEKVEEIWQKLFEVYGNTHFLLQNKLSSLEKFNNLDKFKEDEKIAYSISSLLNVMADLAKLAKNYELEGELYHGGGIHKILDLMGKQRERKFIRSVAREKLSNKLKWEKLETFLKDELKEREAYILNDKVKKCLIIDKNKADEKERKDKSSRDKGKLEEKSSGYMGNCEPPLADGSEKCFCHICGKYEEHVLSKIDGKTCIEYVACKIFVAKNPRERDQLLYKKRLCSKCLKPGVKWNAEHTCIKQYSCNQIYLKNGVEVKCEKHVLVCGYHCKEKGNQYILETYKKNVIKAHGKFSDFSKHVKISCFAEMYNADSKDPDNQVSSIFAFQTIDIAGLKLNIFYDSGCGDLVVSKGAADRLKEIGRANQEFSGPIVLSGVGNQESICRHGVYSIRLPLKNGLDARMCGVCVEEVTAPFPKYPLKEVEKDFRDKIAERNKDILPKLPILPDEVGGKVDIMIGKHYLRYFPREIARLESGLTLYTSVFESPDGSTGVISGPHPEFKKTERAAHFACEKYYSYYSPSVQKYVDFVSLIGEVPLLGYKVSSPNRNGLEVFPDYTCTGYDPSANSDLTSDKRCEYGDHIPGASGLEYTAGDKVYTSKRGPKCLGKFDELDKAGTNISYRCMDCRNCKECKKGSQIEEMSIQEEVEQDLINKSVIADIENRICIAKLPFTADPDSRLIPNMKTARKVYNAQVNRLQKSQKDREDIIEAENKLQILGFVDYLENLNENDRNMILNSLVKYFIPWRVVWSKSLSTPVRPVFDASQRTPGGCSLNDILPKGSNNMNNLVEILMRWSIKTWAYHTDIRKMYNAVQLDKSCWRFQLYLWEKDLSPGQEPLIKVIKTLIYGVRPSGNQAERALRLVSEKCMKEYPIAHEIVQNDIYVDDCISGEETEEERARATDELRLSLEKGGFALKGFTFSGQAPDDKLSADGESVMVGGLKWFPKGDFLMLNVGKINFARKLRGRKVENKSDIPNELTMRDCVSVAAEVFDPTGKVAPIIAGIKLDVSNLHRSGLTWDDQIPENLRKIWISNFGLIEELGTIKYERAIVPQDAKSLDIFTIDNGDASDSLICAAVYARFERKNGQFSCQLVFARTKVLPEGTTTPRGELMAAEMNAATGFTVRKAFGNYHKRSIKLTDSMVALHWIGSQRTVLKKWARTRVIEIHRLSEILDWRYVESANMVADLGTRKGAKITDIDQNSFWINGLPWMSDPEEQFPTQTLEEIRLNQYEIEEANREKIVIRSFHSRKEIKMDAKTDAQIRLRYQFSNYLIDPNRFRFRKVVRILALVLLFIKKVSKGILKIRNTKIFSHKCPGDLPDVLKVNQDRYILTTGSFRDMGSHICGGGKVVEMSEDILRSAMYYFYLKASQEVKHFLESSRYTEISREIDEVLYYSGRILPDYKFEGYPDLCQAAIDLCETSFCVPIMEQYSPIAIAIAMEIHWHHCDVKHLGVEAIFRQTERIAHIIGGRTLTVLIKHGCKLCRILYKKSVDVTMGPIQNINLCIAPSFYASQIDIFGPFKSYSSANKRATIKVWFLIFCCCTTGGIDIRVLEDYSTESFVLGFIRFSCRFGYPKYLLPDSGSQLVKGCESMNYSFIDTKQKLSVEYGVQFTVCPVGAHYIHGKVERKIRQVKKCVRIIVQNDRLSIVQWETLMQQISNSVNNLPIGLKNKVKHINDLDLITPNRLILGRNNERCPTTPLVICPDHKKMIKSNADIFRAWFKSWLISYVPSLIEHPKWHKSDENVNIGDVVLFLKSEKEFDMQYQYGVICAVHDSRDGYVRKVDIEYKNHNEEIKRETFRGVRELVIVYPIDELDIYERLDQCLNKLS